LWGWLWWKRVSEKMKTKKNNGDANASPRHAPEKAVEPDMQRYVLRLYVTGNTPRATASIRNIRKICEEHLQGRYTLEVVDIYQQPAMARDEHILAAPTLIKRLPSPLRRLVGDFSNGSRVLLGLDLIPEAS
jgi:circadian clock protein KaiB